MPQNRSMKKRLRQAIKATARNKSYRTRMRRAIRAAHEAAGTDDGAATLVAAQSAIDKAAKAGAIHQHNASRSKSRLVKAVGA